jgi:hypothetical protein
MLVTQQTAGYNGILWDFMGAWWESADFRGFSRITKYPNAADRARKTLWISL